MRKFLHNKEQATVIVVESVPSKRALILDALRKVGFQNLQAVFSGRELLDILERSDADWIIMPAMLDQDINALQILKLIVQTPKLRGLLCTLFVDMEHEKNVLPLAFELGLFSWHEKTFVRDVIEREFADLLSLLQINKNNPVLTSAEYIRSFLDENKFVDSRLSLEQNLLSVFPGTSKLLISLAEAHFLADKINDGRSILKQVILLNEKLAPHCQRIIKKFGIDDSEKLTNPKRSANSLGLKNVVIVDPDTDYLHNVQELLTKAGVSKVSIFEDGADAWDFIKANPEPQLIIQEWRIPSLTGPILSQRIRQFGYVQVPIIVISSLIKSEEALLVSEMGIDAVLEKPFESDEFFKSVVWLIQQNKNPTEQKSLDLKIRRLLIKNDIEEAKRLFVQYRSNLRISSAAKMQIEAEFEYHLGNYQAAKDLALGAIGAGGDKLLMCNLAGKAFLKLRDFESALKCLDQANKICPMNIDRLLDIAGAQIETGRTDDASKTLDAAREKDSSNEKIASMDACLAMERNDLTKAQSIMKELETCINVLSFMNSRAVALSKGNRFSESIELYKRVLNSLPPKRKELIAAVRYNLGLAFARYGELNEAYKILAKIDDKEDEDLVKKSHSLLARVQESIKSNSKMKILEPIYGAGNAQSGGTQEIKHTDFEQLLATLEIKRGDIACYMIFSSMETISKSIYDLVQDLPRFSERESTEKQQMPKSKAD